MSKFASDWHFSGNLPNRLFDKSVLLWIMNYASKYQFCSGGLHGQSGVFLERFCRGTPPWLSFVGQEGSRRGTKNRRAIRSRCTVTTVCVRAWAVVNANSHCKCMLFKGE